MRQETPFKLNGSRLRNRACKSVMSIINCSAAMRPTPMHIARPMLNAGGLRCEQLLLNARDRCKGCRQRV